MIVDHRTHLRTEAEEIAGRLYLEPGMLSPRPPSTPASDAMSANAGRDFDRALEPACKAGYETVTVIERRRSRQERLG